MGSVVFEKSGRRYVSRPKRRAQTGGIAIDLECRLRMVGRQGACPSCSVEMALSLTSRQDGAQHAALQERSGAREICSTDQERLLSVGEIGSDRFRSTSAR